jgi:hypothetical protein
MIFGKPVPILSKFSYDGGMSRSDVSVALVCGKALP